MQTEPTRALALIVTTDADVAKSLVGELSALGWIGVAADTCDIALEMIETVEFSVVIVDVAEDADWLACRRLVQAHGTVGIISSFLAQDRRYRRVAFEMGIAAYAGKPCPPRRFRSMLRRLQRGERGIEIIGRAIRD